ncbi:MAG: hypothetical protein HBSAPP03_29440 [Phycisphaerae bacterium]|nr:MAG: hypothetical protein HBSAPP03_29440 [Phycisphaerae bacterium]
MRLEQQVIAAYEHLQGGRLDEAMRLLRQVLAKAPGEPNANRLMAMAHGAKHEDEAALFYIARATAASPRDPDLLATHANVLFLLGRQAEAEPILARALAAAPSHGQAVSLMARLHLEGGEFDAASGVYEAAHAAEPANAGLWIDHARLLQEVGHPDEASRVLLRAVAACPTSHDVLVAAAYTLNLVAHDPIAHRDLHTRLSPRWTDTPLAPIDPPNPERPIRVALLSSDYCEHVCAVFLRPLLEHFDDPAITLFSYGTVDQPDTRTAWFRARPNWRDVPLGGRAGLADLCRTDKIDILIECHGWTAGHHLDWLLPRVAPVQATFLGYPNTTGLTTMDFRIVDGVTDPPAHDAHLTERPARVEGCFLCYQPEHPLPEPRPSRALQPGGEREPITFGSFNRVGKITDATVALWSGVLRAVPDSRLLLKARVQSEALNRATAARFAACGVEASRIAFSPFAHDRDGHLGSYGAIDVCLDATPYNGTTTTCEALWMGVPVVTMAGGVHRARVGASLLTAAGKPEWVASDEAGFVTIAAGMARDRVRLRTVHETLRASLLASPLCDARGYARRFGAMLRWMWRQACERSRG